MKNLLNSYLDINGKRLRIAKLESEDSIYIALADLIYCSSNQKNNREILLFCINNNHIKNLSHFTGENNFYVSKRIAIEILEQFPSHLSGYVKVRINSFLKKDLVQQTPQIIDNFEDKISIKKSPDNYLLRFDDIRIPIYEINDFHTLVQFLGYGKYKNKNEGNVYYRGQASLYQSKTIEENNKLIHKCNLLPSLYRKREYGYFKNVNLFYEYVNNITKNIECLRDMPHWMVHPLLQHYGFKTNWLDVVDNVWVALWFASHDSSNSYINNQEIINIYKKETGYAYLFLITSDATQEDLINPGYFIGHKTTVVDLRKALPSTYLRPHAQHALMLRKKDIDSSKEYSYLIIGIAKIPIHKVTEWLGRSGLLSVQSLFPSPYYDFGYRKLLEQIPRQILPGSAKCYGSIQLISHDFF